MKKDLRVLMIGAHPDDCDSCYGGLAVKYIRAGAVVKFMSLCNGNGGHHVMAPDEIAERRYGEVQNIANLAGLVEYQVWRDIPDCKLEANLENRERLVRDIRLFNPDIIISCRPNDYHADHRNTGILVQDASYLLIVPNYCPDAPAMRQMPVICYGFDRFQNPVFQPDVVIATDDSVDAKFEMMDCHVSQFYEWLPYTDGILEEVPEGAAERLDWLHSPKIDRSVKPQDKEVLAARPANPYSEYNEAYQAALYRKQLVKRYGKAGKDVHFAEGYCVCEYGKQMTKEMENELFPL